LNLETEKRNRKESFVSYRIQEHDDLMEIEVWGSTSVWEVLGILYKLHRNDPHKETPDLWILSAESIIPISGFARVVNGLQVLCANLIQGCRSAVVTENEIQKAEMEMFREEAQGLPYEIGVFTSREEAVVWLRS
jgi:hypothetical protein